MGRLHRAFHKEYYPLMPPLALQEMKVLARKPLLRLGHDGLHVQLLFATQ